MLVLAQLCRAVELVPTLLTMSHRRACVLFYSLKLSSGPVAALVGWSCSHRQCSPAHLN